MFYIYIAFTYFVVLNVVTALFCQHAVESSLADRDVLLDRKLRDKELVGKRLYQLFEDIDDINTSEESPPGKFTFDELQYVLRDDQVKARFAIVGIEPEDAWTLFKLIDTDDEKIINTDQFISGCLRLRGDATRLDLELLGYDFQFLVRKLDGFMEHVVDKLEAIEGVRPSALGTGQRKTRFSDLANMAGSPSIHAAWQGFPTLQAAQERAAEENPGP